MSDRPNTSASDTRDGSLPSTGDKLLVASEVAEILAVPVSWVRETTRAGYLPCVRLGRYVRYEKAAVLAWVADQRIVGAASHSKKRCAETTTSGL